MKTNGGNGRDDPERKKRIEELERQAGELTGGEMAGWKSPDLSPELEEDFLQSIVAYESAPWTRHRGNHFFRGVESGFPPP